ncbi:MAG: Pnap_2097 family protein [Methyloligella sp. ZOD6]
MSVVALAPRIDPPLERLGLYRMGMPHLSPGGLSEQWLLRECGDRHWALIADGMRCDDALFTDAEGRPLYAAFCSSSLRLHTPGEPLLGLELAIHSTVWRVGGSRIASVHDFRIHGTELGRLLLISTFVAHGRPDNNRSILRRQPAQVPDLPEPPNHVAEFAAAARMAVRALPSKAPGGEPVFAFRPCPALDFNAVGLLYFPSFSAIADRARWHVAAPSSSAARWARARDVHYLGNIDPGETVAVYARDSSSSAVLELWAENRQRIAIVSDLSID